MTSSSNVFKIIFTISIVLNLLFVGTTIVLYHNFKPLITLLRTGVSTPTSSAESSKTSTSIPAELIPMLESVGVEPEQLPATISPQVEACMRAAVGQQRAAAIEAGAMPTSEEIIKATRCLE